MTHSFTSQALHSWGFILAVVVFSSAGDVLLAKAMTSIGDLDDIMAEHGFLGAVKSVLSSGWFIAGIGAMSLAFFSLLTALSWADLSLVAPASASLTFVASAIAAKYFLKEAVDTRRWIAIAFVCVGVLLLAK
jgi:drug/metabolite transporter (DMT)-like permease